ncbi:MAG: hypothetical protein ACM3X7_07310 [Solirubrobacterales bacterium]
MSFVYIIFIIFYILIMYLVTGALVLKFKISSTKAMLLGIALICFSIAVFKGESECEIINFIFSITGFSIFLAGFFMKDN